ncbi:MAG: HAD family hydrolase [Helicobacteraceae bacterium]|jgi:phosphoglycolate phosphatase|nr:HAD family hydrolase [Helicobacteraceae bacterium]
MPKTIVLFDLDGTLIDSTEAIVESFFTALDCFGINRPDDKAIIAMIGNPLAVMFERLGVAADILDGAIGRYKEHYQSICLKKTVLIDTAAEAVKTLENRARLGVVTTKTSRFSRMILDHLGIGGAFETVIGFEDVTRPKPDAEPIERALEVLGCGGAAFMVGDTPIDMQAALNAGVTPIGLLCGFASREELSAFTSALFETPLEAALYVLSASQAAAGSTQIASTARGQKL